MSRLLTLKDVGWTHVYLCNHYKHRHIQSQCQTQMLLGHANNASVAANLRGE